MNMNRILCFFVTVLVCFVVLPVVVVVAMTDPSTGIGFAPRKNGLELFGVGVRKKGPIKVYSVAMYCTEVVKEKLQSISRSQSPEDAKVALQNEVREAEGGCTFLLEMAFKVGAEKMASAISDSVVPRHKGGNQQDIDQLRELVLKGIPADTGASKGTTLQFDCSPTGLAVAVNGSNQGIVPSQSLAQAFCDVYLDNECVSSALRQSCLDHCCAP